MEKGSQKLIRETSPVKNRFKNMLSEVQLKVPNQIQNKKKPNNLVLDSQSYFDRNSSEADQRESRFQLPNTQLDSLAYSQQKENRLGTNVSQPKKATIHQQLGSAVKILSYMKSRDLLGNHWQSKIRVNEIQLLQHSFNKIKNYQISHIYTFNKMQSVKQSKKLKQLVRLFGRMQYIRLRMSFQKIAQLYKDSLLFGLSNTVAELKENSLVKLESECQRVRLQNLKPLKTQPKLSQKDIPPGVMIKKVSEAVPSYQSLSGLILNHNKLDFIPETNPGYPNIPKSSKSISNKVLPSSKEIKDLQLQTKKKIESTKKLADNKELPIESKKNLNENHKQNTKQNQASDQQEKTPIYPITFTYILKNLDSKNLAPESVNKNQLEQYLSNYKPIEDIQTVESQYHQQLRNVFLQSTKKQTEKRSVSLQIKHLPGLCITPEKPFNQINVFKKSNNEYYNQYNCNRENLRRISLQNLGIHQVKQRAQSATPKITFNFCSSNPQLPPPKPKNKFQQTDYVIQKSLMNDKNPNLKEASNQKETKQQVKNNRLQVVSPSHRRQQKHFNQKLINSQKARIQQKILPPLPNQYYNDHATNTQKRDVILSPSNALTSTDPSKPKKNQLKQFKNSLVNELYFGQIQREQAGCMPAFCQKNEQNVGKLKCHKEKILVTYSNK